MFALVLATVVAQHWVASTPLPWGGPNVVLGTVAALVAAFLIALKFHRGDGQSREVTLALWPVAATVAIAVLWLLWALLVHHRTGTEPPMRLAQTVLGVGVLCATCLAVGTLRRARLMLLTFVLATFVSAVFGLAVAFVQEPFLTVWLRIADVQPKFLEAFWWSRRLAGLAADTPAFGYQLAAALPLAMATLLFAPEGRWHGLANGRALLWYVMLMTLITALTIDGARSTVLAALTGSGLVVALALCMAAARRRLPWVAAMMALWLIVVFHPAPRGAPVVGELPSVTRNDDLSVPAIKGLAVGIDMPLSPEQPRVFAEVRQVTPGSEYTVQVRTRQLHAAGQPGEAIATASDAGKLTVSWLVPPDLNFIRYESRVRSSGATIWRPWQRLSVYGGEGITTAAIATDMRHVGSVHEWAPRLSRLMDWSSYSTTGRLLMAHLAGRTALSNPLGTGQYSPNIEALRDLLPGHPQALELLHGDPHNQFLLVLVDYGLPGFGLLVTLYLLALRSLSRAAFSALKAGDAEALHLVAAIAGAMLAYIVNSLAHGKGPLTGDWGHFLLLGLVFAIEHIVVAPRTRQTA